MFKIGGCHFVNRNEGCQLMGIFKPSNVHAYPITSTAAVVDVVFNTKQHFYNVDYRPVDGRSARELSSTGSI